MSSIISTNTIIPGAGNSTFIPGVGIGGTNIIRNVINIGNASGCDAGTQYCSDGYGLYFPCLKSITKGQSVCFDFYVTDNSTKDVVDLRNVDDITLDLFGAFGCPYGSFSYPDNIQSLQSEEFESVYVNTFGDDKMCTLNVIPLDMDGEDILESKSGNFYTGTEVTIGAKDTDEYIFVGWIVNTDDELCEDDIKNGLVDKKYTFTIYEDKTIYAIYRKRKSYRIKIDSSNINCTFNVLLGQGIGEWGPISNKEIEIFNDGEDDFEILEGYKFAILCIPNTPIQGDEYMYKFVRWDDDRDDKWDIIRYFEADDEIFENGTMYLKAICNGPYKYEEEEEIDIEWNKLENNFGEGVYIETDEFGIDSEENFYSYVDDTIIFPANGEILQGFNGNDGYICFKECGIAIPTDITDGVKIAISVKGHCNFNVKVNEMASEPVKLDSDDFNIYEFYFGECNGSDIEIYADDYCCIDNIEIYKENIIDKGKATLCLGPEITSNLPSGKLSVSGAIGVNGEAYGLPLTQIGEVNKLTKINII